MSVGHADLLAPASAALKAGDPAKALHLLRDLVKPDAPFVAQLRAAKLQSLATAGAQDLRVLKIALLSGSTLDQFIDVFRYWLSMAGIRAEFYVAPFDMMVQSVLDEGSELYAFKPDIVWLFTTFRDIRLAIEPGSGVEAVRAAVRAEIARLASLWQPLARLNCTILQNNVDIPESDAFGNMAGAAPWGSRSALRLLNFELTAAAPPGVVIYDFDQVADAFGKARWIDKRYWFHSKHAFHFDAIGMIAHGAAQLVAAAKGLAKKCLVLDLDNTLWGGVIGDDGLDGIHLGMKADGEAFVAFQAWLKTMKERGVILAVVSKNEEANAREPFEKHPDMRLRLDDIAVFRANWNDKVGNIREIAQVLNIGLDSLVFVDDNPAEREIVRQFLPMVAVPELPKDPSGYIDAVAAGRYFESIAFSADDKERARYYLENAKRADLQLTFKDTASYLTSLDMVGEVGGVDSFHLPRMSQLINKSNQFHLTGTRYSEAELTALASRDDTTVRYFKLRDRFGDNGLIAVVVLQARGDVLHVDTWVMSCRVLARSMEEFIANEMLAVAVARGCKVIEGRYVRSPKNNLVAELYARLGFERIAEETGATVWRRSVADGAAPTSYVRRVEGQAA